MKAINIFAVLTLLTLMSACANDNSVKEAAAIDHSSKPIDTIACGYNQGLIEVEYYQKDQKMRSPLMSDTITAEFHFTGNFKNILDKADFQIEIINDSLTTVKKIAPNKFEIFIDSTIDHFNPAQNTTGLSYWMILKAENTVFEWSWSNGKSSGVEYSDEFKVAKFQPIRFPL